jgi:hypothetical protein
MTAHRLGPGTRGSLIQTTKPEIRDRHIGHSSDLIELPTHFRSPDAP